MTNSFKNVIFRQKLTLHVMHIIHNMILIAHQATSEIYIYPIATKNASILDLYQHCFTCPIMGQFVICYSM